ncbi:VOC family protein [Actinoplanes subglobosus]|uniref:VOC family protein n=1 Tax=Actinoplanes subglobosus TaxID=1547892 RepID=A0ABV8IXR0_9ACTN
MRRHVEVDDADAAVLFYTAVFGGVESSRESLFDGRVLHVDIRVGDYLLSVGTPWWRPHPVVPAAGPSELVLTGADMDQVLLRFAEAGATVERTGDAATVGDRFGHRWHMVRAG